ncbi:hypothetical protein ACEUC3_16685 [Aeromonas bivalvium]|uniref:hypothetical protein n=1 Tax=Aeromonas bivalvium TaxID=440079 RepID=UPI0038CFDF04
MNEKNNNGENQEQIALLKERVIHILYFPLIACLILSMILNSLISIIIVYYTASGSMEPSWVVSIYPYIKIFGSLFNPNNTDISNGWDVAYTSIIGLFAGVLFRRCTMGAQNFDIYVLVTFLFLGLFQSIIINILPTPDDAVSVLSGGKEFIDNLNNVLSRGSNVSFYIVSSTIGIKFLGDQG